MRRLLIALVLVLPGCTLIDAYFMTAFDPNEYRLITEIRVDSEVAKKSCDNTAASKINAGAVAGKTHLFERYSEEIPRNKNGISAAKSLNEIATGLAVRYDSKNPVSPQFCRLKFESIENSARLMQHVIGNKPR